MFLLMKPEEILHDRATRDEELSDDEQARLAAWYAELNLQESEVLFGTSEPPAPSSEEGDQLVKLQQQIETLLIQLTEKTEHLQKVMEENRILREEVALLRAQVAKEVGLTIA